MFGKKKGVLGIDIGTTSVKVSLVEKKGGKFIVKELWERSHPPDTIVEGEIMDREAVVQSLKSFVEERKCGIKSVSSFPPANKGVILKRIKTEKMNEEEARENIKWNADQHIPYDPSEVNMDIVIADPDAGEGMMELILAAARSDVIADYTSLLREAGFLPEIIDVSVFSLHNIFEVNYPEGFENEVIGLVHIGRNFTHIVYTGNKGPLVHRDLVSGTKDCISRLQTRFGVTVHDAENIIKGQEERSLEELSPVYTSFADFLSEEIEKSFPYIPNKEKPDRIFLSGGGSLIPDIDRHIEAKLNISTTLLNIFNNVEISDALVQSGEITRFNAIFPLSVGLSLRGA